MEFGLVTIICRKPHKTLVFSLVFHVQLLLHHENAFLHHAVHEWHHFLETDDFAHLADGDSRLDLQGFHNEILEIVQSHRVELVVGRESHGGLAAQLQGGRQCSLHHLSRMAHVIGLHPVPKLQLLLVDHRLVIEQVGKELNFY